jgi:uncharacterized protein
MLNRWTLVLLSAGVLCGLCAPAAANTTAPAAASALSASGRTGEPAAQTVSIALLLPTRSATLAEASNVLRAGFMAAFEREHDGITVNLIETGDTPQEVLAGYSAASAQNDIVVGPLSRTGVTTVAQRAEVSKPTLALTAPEIQGGAGLPRQLLVMGLSIEDEAKQLADWASFEKPASRAIVVSTKTAWQRRAAQAFGAQWKRLGYELETAVLDAPEGNLSGKDLVQLKKRLPPGQPVVLFAALDAWQARQLRTAVGSQVPMYGTSQLNPVTLADHDTADRVEDMDGTRLLDIPWQLQADHPAVMVYPRLVVSADRKRNADMERLYALGIDAFRVAREIATRHTDFMVDGVTGKLSVRFDSIGTRFERTVQQAVYRDGSVVSEPGAQ